jgi:hypothetical protein
MKRVIILTACLLLSIGAFAQIKEVKTFVGVGAGTPEAFSATVSRGVMYNDSYFVGFGFSVGLSSGNEYVPALLAHGRMNFNIGNGKVVPFVDCKMGMYADLSEGDGMSGFIMRPAVGVTFRRISISAASTCLSTVGLVSELPSYCLVVEYCF